MRRFSFHHSVIRLFSFASMGIARGAGRSSQSQAISRRRSRGQFATWRLGSESLEGRAMLAADDPTLALGTGVAGGATLAEATQASGVMTFGSSPVDNQVTVVFTGTLNQLTKVITSTGGSAQPVSLTVAEVTTLGDGTINVSATQTDGAGNTSPAGTTISFVLDTIAPAAPTLALGTGVAGGATQAEATQASGVVTVGSSPVGHIVTVVFIGSNSTVTKTITSTGGSAQPVVLTTAEVTTLGDGTINVSATQTDGAGNILRGASNS